MGWVSLGFTGQIETQFLLPKISDYQKQIIQMSNRYLDDGYSLADVCRKLDENGYRSVKGKTITQGLLWGLLLNDKRRLKKEQAEPVVTVRDMRLVIGD